MRQFWLDRKSVACVLKKHICSWPRPARFRLVFLKRDRHINVLPVKADHEGITVHYRNGSEPT